MIGMLLADHPDGERKALLLVFRKMAGKYTDEYWNYTECGTLEEVRNSVNEKQDLLCLDITIDGVLDTAEILHKTWPEAYMILIADSSISPLRYLRPAIGAESLLLKPLKKQETEEVIEEAVSTFTRRFLKPDEEKMFVVESRGNRELLEFSKILYFEAREKKVFVNTGSREYGFYETLDELERQYGDKMIRCHRSFLVMRSRIRNVMLSANLILLDDGSEIPLSRSCKPALKEFIQAEKNHAQ